MGTKAVVLGLSGGVDSAVAARLLLEAGYTIYGHWLDIGLGGERTPRAWRRPWASPFPPGTSAGHWSGRSWPPSGRLPGRPHPLPLRPVQPHGEVPRPLPCRAGGGGGRPSWPQGTMPASAQGPTEPPPSAGGSTPTTRSTCWARCPRPGWGSWSFPWGTMPRPRSASWPGTLACPWRKSRTAWRSASSPHGDYARLAGGPGPRPPPGPFVDRAGKVLGTHKGIHHYTIGQRRGLGIPAEHRLFVSEIRPGENTVVLSDGTDLMARAVWGEGWNPWPPGGGRGSPSACATPRRPPPPGFTPHRVRPPGGASPPRRAPTPGQLAVLYRGGHGAGQLLDHRGGPAGDGLREGTP